MLPFSLEWKKWALHCLSFHHGLFQWLLLHPLSSFLDWNCRHYKRYSRLELMLSSPWIHSRRFLQIFSGLLLGSLIYCIHFAEYFAHDCLLIAKRAAVQMWQLILSSSQLAQTFQFNSSPSVNAQVTNARQIVFENTLCFFIMVLQMNVLAG